MLHETLLSEKAKLKNESLLILVIDSDCFKSILNSFWGSLIFDCELLITFPYYWVAILKIYGHNSFIFGNARF